MGQVACHLCQEPCDCQRCRLYRAAPSLLGLLECLTGYAEMALRRGDLGVPFLHAEEARTLIGQLR